MSTTDEDTYNSFVESIKLDVNCLSAREVPTRRRAVEKLQKVLFSDSTSPFSTANKTPSTVGDRVFKYVLQPLLQLFYDNSERCKTIAMAIITEYVQKEEK